jgi:hypothetical protein
MTLRRLPNDPSLCGPRQSHLFVNRPCLAQNTGDNQPDENQSGNNNGPDNNDNHKGGGPVLVLGGSPYHVDNNGPSGDDHPKHGDYPQVGSDPQLCDPPVATPEPTYVGVTGLAFVGIWMLARKRRTA